MRRRRRLLIASQPLDAGVPHHILDLLHAVDPDDWTIDVACPRDSILWASTSGRREVSLHEIGGHRRPSLGDLRSLVRLIRLVGRADVIHGHSSKAGFLVRTAAMLRGRTGRCVFTPHGWSFWVAGGLVGRCFVLLERLAARWCRLVIAVSEAERDAGLREGVARPSQYRVILNGVDLARFGAEPSPEAGQILFIGRLARPKRPDLVLRAFRVVRAQLPEAGLQLVGDGPQRSELEALARQLGVENARFLGTRDDIPDLLCRVSCLVLASDWEGCPLAVLEAMAAGVPVVATRVGGVEELVEDGRTGSLVDAGDEQGLAAAIVALLSDPARAATLGANGRERARARFSRERMAAEVLSVYDTLAPPRRHA